MAKLPIFSPTDLGAITDCTLKFHFLQQPTNVSPTEVAPLKEVVLETINYLHAAGGPYRLNLPTILRHLRQIIPAILQDEVAFNTTARQLVANYHRGLKADWAKVIASREPMRLTIRLQQGGIRAEAIIDRVDKEEDGGITAIKFIAAPHPIPETGLEDDIETTVLHALVAAAYPDKRPVRVKYLWLYHNQEAVVELAEKAYRRNLDKLKKRVQAWQRGEILARPGSYCDSCPFQYQGCPIYLNESAEEPVEYPIPPSETDLPPAVASATLPSHNTDYLEGEDFAETETDS